MVDDHWHDDDERGTPAWVGCAFITAALTLAAIVLLLTLNS